MSSFATRFSRRAAFLMALWVAGGCSIIPFRSRPTPPPSPLPASTSAVQLDRQGGKRSYESITRDAETRFGLFNTHLKADTLFFEIPRSELGKVMLLLRRTAAGNPDVNAQPARTVAWELENDRVVLRERRFAALAPEDSPIREAVDGILFGGYIATFDVVAFGPDSSLVIVVTPLFTTNRGEFVGVRSIATDRSFIESVAAFPENVNVVAVQTGVAPPANATANAPSVAYSVRLEWSLLKLPEDPMMPRLYDSRVGYFTADRIAFGADAHTTRRVQNIRRFRLEKADPAAEVSDPVRPIVFWVDRATPEWLVPWVMRGIEEWQPAFEAAGFSNAIVARRAPSPEEDPDWSPRDARHSIVYWRPSTTRNAIGEQVVDPRSGEILKAEVSIYHDVMALLRNWYFVQASAVDPRARTLPFPDSLMGRLVQHVVAHEVGHAIGLQHNFKASAMVPADSVRSVSFLRRMGSHTPTIMSYSRFNYVAQPGDNIPVDLLIPSVGPYDRFAIMWGHRPIPGATTPEEELPTLHAWASVQDTVPWYRYQTPDATNDPANVTEAVGNADPVTSSRLALRNLERVVVTMIEAAEQPGEDYSLLRELYDAAVTQWGNYMRHVVALIGGADSRETRGTGPRFFPIPRARQVEAMAFLRDHAFRPPTYLLDPEILRRLEPSGALSRIASAQSLILADLFNDVRLSLLVEYEALAARPGDAYTVADLARDTRAGVWGELSDERVRIDVFRRTLQRSHIGALGRVVQSGLQSDARPILRGELIELDRLIERALPRAADTATRLHLEDARHMIASIIDPEARGVGVVPSAFASPTNLDDSSGAYFLIDDCFQPDTNGIALAPDIEIWQW